MSVCWWLLRVSVRIFPVSILQFDPKSAVFSNSFAWSFGSRPIVQVELVRVLRCVANSTGDLPSLASKAHYDVVGMLRHVASTARLGSLAKKEVDHLLAALDEPAPRGPLPPIA